MRGTGVISGPTAPPPAEDSLLPAESRGLLCCCPRCSGESLAYPPPSPLRWRVIGLPGASPPVAPPLVVGSSGVAPTAVRYAGSALDGACEMHHV